MAFQAFFNRPTLAALLFLTTLPTFAENAVVGTGTPASCTETTFNAALALVVNDIQGGVLSFNCGPDPDIILLSSVKNLVGVVTIDGGNKMTLDGQDVTRLFNINQDGVDGRTEVTIKNITLTRGNSGAQPFGGLVLVNANTQLNVDNVTMSNSLASTSGGAIATFANVSLNVANSRFLGNLSANGGAIATRAIVTIENSTFTNNNASLGEGGAIQSYEQRLVVRDSTFTGNGAGNGGAIFKRDSEVTFERSNFEGNSSGGNGGALFVSQGTGFSEGRDSIFRRNSATLDGGAMYVAGSMALFDTSLSGNTARAGGAIRADLRILLRRATLASNTAQTEGGAISASVTLPNGVEMDRVTTNNNRTIAGPGGDFAFSSNNTGVRAFITHNTLVGAQASSGGRTLHLSGMGARIGKSLLWSDSSMTCSAPPGLIQSERFNISTFSCGLNSVGDGFSETLAGFGLGEFANYGGRLDVYLPLPGSAAIDRSIDSCGFDALDARGKPTPIDGDGNGSALCDVGAVERQLREPLPALFRDGFEE
jgi:predicted outer membrane repeat protein